MKKINLFLSLFLLHGSFFASEESPCTRIQEDVANLLIGLDIRFSQIIMTDDEIICRAAESRCPGYMQYCLKNNIGSLNSETKEGYKPFQIARIVKNKQVLEIIEEKEYEEAGSPRTVTGLVSPVSSPQTSKKYN